RNNLAKRINHHGVSVGNIASGRVTSWGNHGHVALGIDCPSTKINFPVTVTIVNGEGRWDDDEIATELTILHPQLWVVDVEANSKSNCSGIHLSRGQGIPSSEGIGFVECNYFRNVAIEKEHLAMLRHQLSSRNRSTNDVDVQLFGQSREKLAGCSIGNGLSVGAEEFGVVGSIEEFRKTDNLWAKSFFEQLKRSQPNQMDIPDIEIKEENDDFGSIVVKEEYNYYNYAEEPQNNAVYANGLNFIKTEKEDEEPEEIKEELVQERNKLGIYQILYKCTMCSINFEGKKDLLHHHTKHHVGPTKPFKCLYCEMVFTTFGYIEAHVFKNHRGLPIDAIDKIKHHVATFHEKKQLPKGFPEIWKMFSCPTTGRTYYAHCLRKKTEEVPKNRCGPTFTCPICFRKFCKEGTFNNHITKHTREHEDNPADGVTKSEVYMRNGKSKVFFKCRLCNRMYTTRDEVMKHEKCHEEYKNLDRVNSLYLLLKKANSVKTIVRSNNATTASTKAQTSTIVNSTGVTTIKNEIFDC
uniref:C2H2-type domain-containing protein n=1 Tax=Lutzomyia longipalpis TaxID=7200 RepID=A0A1B0CGX1_LUTLO